MISSFFLIIPYNDQRGYHAKGNEWQSKGETALRPIKKPLTTGSKVLLLNRYLLLGVPNLVRHNLFSWDVVLIALEGILGVTYALPKTLYSALFAKLLEDHNLN